MIKKSKRTTAIAIISLMIAASGAYMFIHRNEQSTDDAMIEGKVVTISPKVSGYVKLLKIKDNQEVKAGDIIAEIDPADYIIRRDKAQYALDAAKARVISSGHTLETTKVSAPSNLSAAQAQVAAAQATWQKAANDLKRMQELDDESRSRQQLDEAIAAEKTTRSNLENVKAQLLSAQTAPKTIATAESNESVLEAEVKQAETDLAQAEKDLADTKIIAPIDGKVTKKGFEQGDFVQPGQQLGYLVSHEIWVNANFKETQLKKMKIGQRVAIDVDAFPSTKLEGKIESIQNGTGTRFSAFPAENASGNFVKIVQRVPVKIVITNSYDNSLPLGPGMSVTPTVYTE